jgi:hypothetical protein
MASTLQSMVLLHLDSRQAPPYKSLGEARGLRLGSGMQNHEHEANKLKAT